MAFSVTLWVSPAAPNDDAVDSHLPDEAEVIFTRRYTSRTKPQQLVHTVKTVAGCVRFVVSHASVPRPPF